MPENCPFMKVSYKWLSEYIDHGETPEKVAEILTNTGLEVEEHEIYSNIPPNLEGLLTGKVEKVEQHPDADKLKVTYVDTGAGDNLRIICGAPNVAEGQKVVVAPVGTTISNSKGELLKIKKSKLRGVTSHGMIVSEEEIGLSDDHSGIMVLPDDTPVGNPFTDYLHVYEDDVFEIGLTPNRSDAASHTGVARDLSAYLDKPVHFPNLDEFTVDKSGTPVNITIADPYKCPRYSGLVIENVQVAESPEWLQSRLKAIGLQPINNIVDITNFVMMELGHPLHAFDLDKVAGNEISIQSAPKGRTFVTLDGEYRTLEGTELMICDAERPIAMAGIMGGEDSGISEGTTTIFLESAYFDPATIRQASKRHQLVTDASFRFERGADPSITTEALKRTAILIRKIAGGKIASDIMDAYPNQIEPAFIELDLNYLDKLLGYTISRDRVQRILERLGFDIKDAGKTKMNLTAPTYRVDVTRQVDVVEEVIRIHSLDAIEVSPTIKANLAYENDLSREKLKDKLAGYLTGNGFLETINAPFTSHVMGDKFPVLADQNAVPVVNPLSRAQNRLRKSSLITGLESVVYNINRGNPDLRLFEFGRVYWDTNGKIMEGSRLSLFLTGRYHAPSWYQEPGTVDIYYVKALVHNLLNASGVFNWDVSGEQPEEYAYNLSYQVNNRWLVDFGLIRPAILKHFDIDQDVFYANFDLDHLYTLNTASSTFYRPISKYPAVDRDLSMILPEQVQFGEIKELIRSINADVLKSVRIFDVYQGDKIEAGYKSYAIRLVFQDESKTLKDKEVDKIMQSIMQKLEKEAGATIRK